MIDKYRNLEILIAVMFVLQDMLTIPDVTVNILFVMLGRPI